MSPLGANNTYKCTLLYFLMLYKNKFMTQISNGKERRGRISSSGCLLNPGEHLGYECETVRVLQRHFCIHKGAKIKS